MLKLAYVLETAPTVAFGLDASLPKIKVGVGVSVQSIPVAIYRKDAPARVAYYMAQAVGAGFGLGATLANGAQANEFEAAIADAANFYGRVSIDEASAYVGFGAQWQRWKWISGPASGLEIAGWGLVANGGAAVGTTKGFLDLRFLGSRRVPLSAKRMPVHRWQVQSSGAPTRPTSTRRGPF